MYNVELIDHLMYADDVVLLSSSVYGLQKTLLICEHFATECDIILIFTKLFVCISI